MSAVFKEIALPNGRRLFRPRAGMVAVGGRIVCTEEFAPFVPETASTRDRIYTVEVELSASGEATFKILDPSPGTLRIGYQLVKPGLKRTIKSAGLVLTMGRSSHQLCFNSARVDGANQLVVAWNSPDATKLAA